MINKIVGVAVGLLVAAAIVPISMTTLLAANHTGVNAAVWTVFSILMPILAIIGLALYLMPRVGGKD
jgi:hypothetical protein